jgi:O-acetylhomoserine/O-acetylserine sulfhydrylase-like pyridoxal-dependent enzyme
MADKTPGFDTLALHAGAAPDPTTGARITIYQTTAYVFQDVNTPPTCSPCALSVISTPAS